MKLSDCFTEKTFSELHKNNIINEEIFLSIDWNKIFNPLYRKELTKKLNIKKFDMSEKAIVECVKKSQLTKVFFNDKI